MMTIPMTTSSSMSVKPPRWERLGFVIGEANVSDPLRTVQWKHRLWFRGQGSSDQLVIVARQDMPIGISRRRPDDLPSVKGMCGIQHMDAAQFLITPRGQPGPDQVPLVSEKQRGISV